MKKVRAKKQVLDAVLDGSVEWSQARLAAIEMATKLSGDVAELQTLTDGVQDYAVAQAHRLNVRLPASTLFGSKGDFFHTARINPQTQCGARSSCEGNSER